MRLEIKIMGDIGEPKKIPDQFITTKDAAMLFGMSNDHIARLCRAGKISGVLQAGVWLIAKNSLIAFFAERGVAPRIVSADQALRPAIVLSERVPMPQPVPTISPVPLSEIIPPAGTLAVTIAPHKDLIAYHRDKREQSLLLYAAAKKYALMGALSLALFVSVLSLPYGDLSRAVVQVRESARGAELIAAAGTVRAWWSPLAGAAMSLNETVDGFFCSLFCPMWTTTYVFAPQGGVAQTDRYAPAPVESAAAVSTTTYVYQTIQQYPVIERIIERAVPVPGQSVPPTLVSSFTQTLMTASNLLTQTIANPTMHYVPETNSTFVGTVDVSNISGATISDSSFSGGSISGTTITGGSIETPAATTTVLYAASSTLGSLKLADTDCSGYGNGGKLTTDAFGMVVCAADQGGAGGTVAGVNGQVQFNDGGAFGASSSFTFSTSTNRLTVTNASTTNLSVTNLSDSLLYATASGSVVEIATSSLGLPEFSDLAGYLTLAGWYATTTDALDEGSANLYFTNPRVQTYLDTLSKGFFFSTTSANYWKSQTTFTGASTTLLADNNTWTNLNQFANASSTLMTLSGATWVTGGTASTLLALDADKRLVSTTTIGTNLLTGTLAMVNGTALTAGGTHTITAASSTLLANNNTWSGTNIFSQPLSLSSTSGTTTIASGQGFTIGATQFVLQQGSGRVGIGTNAPTYQLDVTGTGRFTSTLALGSVTTCTGGQALQTDGSGNISCGSITVGGSSTGGGWTTNNVGRVSLATTTDLVVVGASTTPYAKFSILSGAVATTTFSLSAAASQSAHLIDIYDANGVLSTVMTADGKFGLGNSAPSEKLNVQGTVAAQVFNATGTNASTFAGGLISQASSTFSALLNMTNANVWGALTLKATTSSLLATDASGTVVATTTIGTNLLAGTLGTINGQTFSIGGNISVSAASSTLLASNNTWSGNNIFNGTVTLSTATSSTFAITSIPHAILSTNANGSVVATTTIGWNLIKGAASSIFAFDASGNPVATTSIGVNYLTGILAIANGGTATSTQVTNGINYFDGTHITSGTGFVFNGTNVGIGTTTPDTIVKIASPGIFTNTQANLNVQALINGATPAAWFNTWHPGAGPPGNRNTEAITGAIDVPATATVHESAGIAGYVRSQKSSSYGSDVGGFFQAEAAANGTSVLGIDSECVVGTGLTSAICQNIFRTRLYSPGVQAIGLNVILDGTSTPSTSYGVAVQSSNASTTWGWGFVSAAGAATTGIELAGVTTGNSVDSQPIKLTGTNASGVTKSATMYANKDGELFIQPQSLTSFSGNVGIGTTTPYSKLTTWGTGSLFEAVTNSSSTVFSIGQNGATTTNFAISNLASALLSTNANGSVVATTSIGTNLLQGTLGTINGTTFTRGGTITITAASSTLLSDNNTWTGATNTYNGNISVDGFINTSAVRGGYRMDGNLTLYSSTTNAATLVGYGAGGNLATSLFDVFNTTAVGYEALNKVNTSSSYNTALGYRSLYNNTSGSFNVGVGPIAASNVTSGSRNIGIGYSALGLNATGGDNVAIGYEALLNNDPSVGSIAIGTQAAAGTGGYSNTGSVALGYQAGYNFTNSSNYNALLGYRAGYDITSGANNTILGQFTTTGTGITTGSNNILIGNGVAAGLSQIGSNQLNIGNLIFGTGVGASSTVAIGNVGIGTTTPYSKLTTWGTGSLFEAVTNSSSTVFSIGQNGATTTNFAISGITNSLLSTNANGSVVATTSIGWNLIKGPASSIFAFDASGNPTATTTIGTNYLIGPANSILSTNSSGAVVATTSIGVNYLTGILPIANGGTATSTQVTNGVNFFDGTRITSGTALTFTGTNLGIGTTSPSQKLHVDGGNIRVDNTGASASFIAYRTDGKALSLAGAANGATFRYDNSGTFKIQSQAASDIIAGNSTGIISVMTVEGAAPADSLYISAAGNVGIGTTTPSHALTVTDSSAPQIALADGTAANNLWTLRSVGNFFFLATSTATATSTVSAFWIDNNAIAYHANGFVSQASSTIVGNFTTTGNTSLQAATTTNLAISNITSAILSTNANGSVVATTSIGWNYITGGPTGANPTASVGLTAVNGTASTFMRSDAAPALSQSIAPTWTGLHTFNTGGFIVNASSTHTALLNLSNSTTSLATISTLWTGLTGNTLLTTDGDGKMVASSTIGSNLLQVPANSLLAGNASGQVIATTSIGWNLIKGAASSIFAFDASGNPTATTSIGVNYLSGILPIAKGGTATSTQVTNGVNFFDGTRITSNSLFTYNGTTTSLTANSANTSGNVIASQITGTQSVGSTGVYTGLYLTPTYSAASGNTLAALAGLQSSPSNSNSGTITQTFGILATPANTGTGTTTAMYSIVSQPRASAGGVTTMYGAYLDCGASGASAVVSTCYGLRIGPFIRTGTVTTSYGLYQDDTLAMNYFGGNVGVGTSSPTAQLHTTGTVRFSNFGAGTLTTDASGNVSVSSDERLKNIDDNFVRGLEDLMKISPVNYHWNKLSGLDTENQYTGFSAQNVQTAIPEAVGENPNGYLSLNDRPILAAVVNAVKEIGSVTGSFRETLVAWLGDASNGIAGLFVKELHAENVTADTVRAESKLCVGSVCVTEAQFMQMVAASGQAVVQENPPTSDPTPDTTTTTTDTPAASDTATTSNTTASSTSEPAPDTTAADTTTSADPAPEPTPDTTTTTTDTSVASDTTTTPTEPAPEPTPESAPDPAPASEPPAETPAP